MLGAKRLLAVGGVMSVIAVVPVGVIAARGGPSHSGGLLLGAHSIPTNLHVGEVVNVRGRVHGPLARVAELENRTAGRWKMLAVVHLRAGGGSFDLRWQVPPGDAGRRLSLRVAVIADGRTQAATSPVRALVAARDTAPPTTTPTQTVTTPRLPTPAPTPACAAPATTVSVPSGDGWIVGGLYIGGGPPPGTNSCASSAYTIEAVNQSNGAVAATQNVAGGQSYTLVVPAGNYALKVTSGCPGSGAATVTDGRQTDANASCAVP